MSASDYLVSTSGQMCVPAPVRHRWGLQSGGHVTIVDLGDAVVLLPSDARRQLIDQAVPADEHLANVRALDDTDLATT